MPEAQWDYSLREVERSGRVSEKFRKIRKKSKKFEKIPKFLPLNNFCHYFEFLYLAFLIKFCCVSTTWGEFIGTKPFLPHYFEGVGHLAFLITFLLCQYYLRGIYRHSTIFATLLWRSVALGISYHFFVVSHQYVMIFFFIKKSACPCGNSLRSLE